MNEHDDFWRTKARDEDYADLNIPTAEQVKFLAENIAPAVYGRNATILEIGCGYGRLTHEMQRKFPKCVVVGMDLSEHIIVEAVKRRGIRNEPLYYAAPNIKGIPPKEAIYCVQVFQHLPSDRKREYIQEVADALVAGGVFVFQYVEGDSNTFLTHDAQWSDVSQWLVDAGFEVASVENNLIQDRWTWVVAVKG